jgi:hypothetical protein
VGDGPKKERNSSPSVIRGWDWVGTRGRVEMRLVRKNNGFLAETFSFLQSFHRFAFRLPLFGGPSVTSKSSVRDV